MHSPTAFQDNAARNFEGGGVLSEAELRRQADRFETLNRVIRKRALVSDLKGKVDMDFAETGLVCNIVIPVDAYAAPAL